MKFKIGDKVRLRYDKGYTKEACKEIWTVDEINPTFITVMSPKASMDKYEEDFEFVSLTMYTTQVESKYAPHPEVWFMYNNRIHHRKIKSVRADISEKHFLVKYIFDRILGTGDDLTFQQYQLFETKEDLIKSL